MTPLGVALIGYGGIGRVHAQGYRALPLLYGLEADALRLVAVATSRPESAARAARELGGVATTTDYRTLLERSDVDLVDVCTPNADHERVVRAAAEAGKHVYCEKPLAADVAAARRMVEAAEAAGVKGGQVFNYRFVPAVMRARQLIEQGRLGRVFSFHGRYFRSSYVGGDKPLSWRLRRASAGGGALYDLGAHALDLVRHLLGEIAGVHASLQTLIERRPRSASDATPAPVDVDDLALLQLRLQDGTLGTVEVSRFGTGSVNDLRLEVFGERGALRFALEDPNWLDFYDGTDPEVPLGGRGFQRLQTVQRYEGQQAPDWTTPTSFDRAHAENQFQFARAIWDDRPPAPSLADGLAVQRLLDAAQRSAKGEQWITLA